MNIFEKQSKQKGTQGPVDQTVLAKTPPQTVGFERRFDRLLFYDSLAKMMDSGIDYLKALELLSESGGEQNARFTKVCDTFADLLAQGKPLSGAIAAMPAAFPKYAQRIMFTAEKTGKVVAMLQMLARDERNALQLQRKLLRAVFYPGLAMIVAIMVGIGTWGFLQQMLPVFEELGIKAPWHLELMMTGFQILPYLIGIGLFLGLVLYRERQSHTQASNSQLVQSWRKRWRQLPGLKTLSGLAANSRFCELLALQLEVGVDLLQAVDTALLASNDPFLEEESDSWHRKQNPSERRHLKSMARRSAQFRERLKKAWERFSQQKSSHTIYADMKNGASLQESLKDCGLINPVVVHFVESGEETGKLPENLRRAAVHLQAEFDYQLEAMNALLEPIMILAVGGFVGTLMLSVFIPLTEILNKL